MATWDFREATTGRFPRLLEPIGYIPPAEAEANTTGNSPVRSPRWRPDLNQLASTNPGVIHLL